MKKLLMVSLVSTVGAAGEVAVTIYNNNLAVIRDRLPIALQAGETSVNYDRATAQLIPDSVVLRDPTGENDFVLREQSYRNDPVSQGLLLSLFEGKEIPFRKIHPNGKVDITPGTIVRSGYQPGSNSPPIIETADGLQFSLPGEPIFPSLGDNSILRPTLSWTLASDAAGSFEAQISYLTRGLTWEASYNLVAPEEGEAVTLSGWITASNNSGTAFQKAKVKLVAGEVNVVPPKQNTLAVKSLMKRSDAFASGKVQEKAFDDFHLYTLPRPISLQDKETKQVEFLRSAKVLASKSYLYDPVRTRFSGGRNQKSRTSSFTNDVAIYWNFKNSEENGLGVAMPHGIVRFYREDSDDGNLEFVGENRIGHTPANEDLQIFTGNAFDLVGERQVTDFIDNDAQDWMKETIEITLKNRSKKAQTITAREHLWRWSNWTIESEAEFKKTNSATIEFTAKLEPDEVRKISYQVTYSW